MFSEDWPKAKAADRRHCPACGHTDHSDRWWTGEQIEDAKAAAIAQFKAQFSKALKADAVRFNRSRPRVMVLRSRERPCASGWSRTGFGCRATSGGYFIARGSGANAMAS
jgi:RNA polymerase subunit RPABC4/transcription elongation factor Spt4